MEITDNPTIIKTSSFEIIADGSVVDYAPTWSAAIARRDWIERVDGSVVWVRPVHVIAE